MNDVRTQGHVADRLIDAVAAKRAPVCVGIDPVVERLPKALRPNVLNREDGSLSDECAARAIEEFVIRTLDAVRSHVPCVKMQSACFERYRAAGVAALDRCIQYAHEQALMVILDAKRGDIGITAAHYAAAAFDHHAGQRGADWLTINAYFGADGVQPFLQQGHGAFALVRTSNPSSEIMQTPALQDGRTIAEHVADFVAELGRNEVGSHGYSALGAVVAATWPNESKSLRTRMDRQIFLVPGYGAQGGGVDDVLPCFHSDGRGAIVTASRSVIYAYQPAETNWSAPVSDAAAAFAENVGRAVGMR